MLINREELLNILSMVQPGLATKGVIEQADTFVFHGGRVVTFNDEIAVSHPLPDGLDELHGAVRAKELFSFLSKFKKHELELELNKKEMLLKTKRSKSGIMFEMDINLPLDEMGVPEKWMKLPNDFVEGVKTCSISVGSDMTAPALCCIHLHNGFIESTDNHRITRYELSKKAFKKGLLIPATSLRLIENYHPIKYAVTDGWVHFISDNDVMYSCRTFDDVFPDIAQFLDVISGKAVMFPDETVDIINRVSVFSSSDIQNAEVEINIKKNWIEFRCQNDIGHSEEKTRIKYNGPSITMRMNPTFLISIMPHINEGVVSDGGGKIFFCGDRFDHLVCLMS